jgi:hypothetical protein
MVILQHEMQWTTLFFKHHASEWSRRASTAAGKRLPGHEAYALKQVAMWLTFARRAQQGFAKFTKDGLYSSL